MTVTFKLRALFWLIFDCVAIGWSAASIHYDQMAASWTWAIVVIVASGLYWLLTAIYDSWAPRFPGKPPRPIPQCKPRPK